MELEFILLVDNTEFGICFPKKIIHHFSTEFIPKKRILNNFDFLFIHCMIFSDTELSMFGNTSTHLLVLLIVLLLASNVLIYIYMKKKYSSVQHLKNIGSPCFDSYPNQYSSLPSKEEQPKVKRQSSFSGMVGANTKLLSNAQVSLAKSNNVSGHHTPKVLNIIENDTATIKRNSHGLNNSHPVRCIDEDKF